METIIKDLLDISKRQSDNVQELSNTVKGLTNSVADKPSKKSSYGFAIAMAGIMGALILIVVGSMFLQLKHNSDLVRDCVSVDGTCRNQRIQDAAQSDLVILCNIEKEIVITVKFDSVPEARYSPTPECIPYIENVLKIDIPKDGIVVPIHNS